MFAPGKKSYEQTRQHITIQRHYLANKHPFSQCYGFSSGHVWMWELDHKESCCCYIASVVSDSVWPQRLQPTRLPCPWDSLGKNTGVGCHCLFQCMKVKSESEVAQLCPTLSDPMDCSPPGSSIHGIFQARVLEWVAIAFSERKLSAEELMLLNCGFGEDSWESLGLQGDPTSLF